MIRKYVAIYDCNNGYTCSCCGKEWAEVEEDDWDDEDYSEEDIIKHYKSKEYDDGEKTLTHVYRVELDLIK